MRTNIVYEDENLLIVHKPAGLATQSAKIGQPDVVSELKNYLAGQNVNKAKASGTALGKGKEIYLGIIHRLDQPVEGLLVFAKKKQTAAELTRQLAGGTLNKKYYAIICGKPSLKEGELVDYLLKGNDNRAKVVTGEHANYPDAKKAVLQYEILEEISTPSQLALADIHIDTGRFHQIRAQMAQAGMPLLGDNKYGTPESLEISCKLGIRNVMLCAYGLELIHPSTHKKLSFQIKPKGNAYSWFSREER